MTTARNNGVPVPPSPHTSVPGKFSLSGPFAALLGEFTIEQPDPHEQATYIVHEPCLGTVREVNADDGMDVLVQAVITHDC